MTLRSTLFTTAAMTTLAFASAGLAEEVTLTVLIDSSADKRLRIIGPGCA